MEHLSYRRYDTTQHLADEFGVSRKTVTRDMRYLETEYPLIFTRGFGGGVALPEGYYIGQKRLTQTQSDAIRRLMSTACERDREILKGVLFAFAGSC